MQRGSGGVWGWGEEVGFARWVRELYARLVAGYAERVLAWLVFLRGDSNG